MRDTTMIGRLKNIPLPIRLALVISTLCGLGLISIFLFAAQNPRNLDGKQVKGITFSPVDNQCVRVTATFDKEKVRIFTGDSPIRIREDLVIQRMSSIEMVLARRPIEDLKKIRVLDGQHNAFLDLN